MPTPFANYIYDIIVEIKQATLCLESGDFIIVILLHAADIVLLTWAENDPQNLLNIVYCQCSKWGLKINKDKNQVMHFRMKVWLFR